MRTLFLSVLIALAGAQILFGQVESFDIATFIRPSGWSRSEINGIVVLQDRKTLMGQAAFCQIYLFPSQPTSTSAAINFRTEWDARIRRTYRVITEPAPQTETTPDGWTAFSAVVDVVRQRVPMRIVLVTSTGFGRMISVMVAVSPTLYQAELEAFFRNLNFHVNVGGQPAAGPSQPLEVDGKPPVSVPDPNPRDENSLANYVYSIPIQWTRRELRDRIVLTSPTYPLAGPGFGPKTGQTTENCQLTLLPLRAARGALSEDAIGAFREMFRADPLTTYPSPPPTMASGTSAQGWEYFLIRKLVGGQEGEARTTGVTLLLAKTAGQVATIVGTSKDFLWSACFGELRGDAWPGFFYSLQFKNARPSEQERAVIRERLTGSWTHATAKLGLQYSFQADGRYVSATAVRYDSSGQFVQTSAGSGRYSVDGDTLVLVGDNNRRTVQFFRVARVSRDSGQTWQEQLCLMEPGSKGEVCYKRQ